MRIGVRGSRLVVVEEEGVILVIGIRSVMLGGSVVVDNSIDQLFTGI